MEVHALEMWISGDYYRIEAGERVHATSNDWEGLYIGEHEGCKLWLPKDKWMKHGWCRI